MSYIGKQPTIGNFVKLDTITTSATATYNLLNGGVAYSPQSANHCIVSLNGVIQSPNTSFTISGSTIVFASTLSASDVIDFILVLGDVLNIGTPSDNTVSTAKLASSLVVPYEKGGTGLTTLGTASQVLRVNSGATALEFGTVSSKIVQVVSAIKTDTQKSNSSSYVDISGLSASITPTSASNKVLVFCNLSLTAQHGNGGGALLLRGSTAIGQADANGSTRRSSFSGSGYTGDGSGTDIIQIPLSTCFLDSPATTSSTTYKVQVVSEGSNYWGVNVSVAADGTEQGTTTDSLRMVSTITLMEVQV